MSKTRILIVDDSQLMRQLVRSIVEQNASLSVVGEASDGEAAFRLVKKEPPDIILLDLMMRGMDGFEFLKRCRMVCDSKVIVISSLAADQSISTSRCIDLGAFAVLEKPSGAISADFREKSGEQLMALIESAQNAMTD